MAYYTEPRFRPVQGIWIGYQELASLPENGTEFAEIYADAIAAASDSIDVSNQDDKASSRALAAALVGMRIQSRPLMDTARAKLDAAIGTQAGARTLALGRKLPCLGILAQVLGVDDPRVDEWLDDCRFGTFGGRTLISTSEDRANNWRSHALFARLVIARYRKDVRDILRCARIFAGVCGDRSAYAGFRFGDLDWQADRSAPVPINPRGATIDGHNVDGVQPEEMRRGGGFVWPPPSTGSGIDYSWEALQGDVATAVALERCGFDAFEWGDQAILRAVRWLEIDANAPAAGDDRWIPHLMAKRFPLKSFRRTTSSQHGKHVGWTQWTTLAPSWAAPRA